MNPKLLLFILTLFAFKAFGQPGGGGGLIIGSLYNKKGAVIDLKDPHLKIRVFAMADSAAQAKVLQELYPEDPLKLPPDFSNYQTANYYNLTHQRLWVRYKKESMILDLQGIIPQNGAGHRDRMDSLVFRKGHFLYNRSPREPDRYAEMNKAFRAARYRGFTPATLKLLLPIGWIKQYKKLPKNFLSEANLTATFYLRRAEHYNNSKEPDRALPDVLRAREMGLSPKEQQEALLLLYSINLQKAEYGKAEAAISELIRIRKDKTYLQQHYGIDHIKDSYRDRIGLYLKMKEFGKALADHDSLVKVVRLKRGFYKDWEGDGTHIPDPALDENRERALFKIKYLQDPKGAIADLMATIQEIPEDHLNDRLMGWSEYSDTYFTLALAHYYNGENEKAWKNWLKALEIGYGQETGNATVIHFDSLLQKHPAVPELYLSRAIAQYKKAAYWNRGANTTAAFESALQDLDRAETMGFRDFRINLYRAMVLNFLKQPEKALEQINLALGKNRRDPRVYLQRYWIRDHLGLVKNRAQETDPDWLKYEELIKTWKFEK